MKTGFLPLLAGAALLALAGTASAGDRTPSAPLRLSDAQMDGVTAGATAIGVGFGAAAGTLFSGTAIEVATQVVGPNAAAAGDVISAAASFTPGPGAAAVSQLQMILVSP
ncbi:MAG TPA: hypothetical protein VJR47_18695 [Stellaceae bacterium]|nr:hypothetical protein [Stellaceae bacterium]